MTRIVVENLDFAGSSYWQLAQECKTSVAQIRIWEAQLKGKAAYRPNKWDFVDWARTDRELSDEMGVSESSVQRYRRERCSKKATKRDSSVGTRLPSVIRHALEFQASEMAKMGSGIKSASDLVRMILTEHVKKFQVTTEDNVNALRKFLQMGQTQHSLKDFEWTMKELASQHRSKTS